MTDIQTEAAFIAIPGVLNFRDIGGYPVSSQPGKEVRRSVVYRSADPSQATEEGVARIRQLAISTVYDLRSEPEVRQVGRYASFGEALGAKRIFAPVFREVDYSPEAVAVRFKTYGGSPEVRGFHENTWYIEDHDAL
jgi:hypothetical protein